MFVLKLIGKVCALPVIIVLAVLLGIVKVCVGIYNFARALFGLLIGGLVILTVIYYQDWVQIGLLVIISFMGISILTVGIFLEMMLESGISRLSKFVLS
ncbi:hypothetical protein IMSAGC015_00994 [Lachnospiraceae bacterium]|nr:hypothetical protein IMSAGC015_00994 [Lachnospiraceae bacterium]